MGKYTGCTVFCRIMATLNEWPRCLFDWSFVKKRNTTALCDKVGT